MFLLDTNTIIYFFKGMGHVTQKMASKSPREIAISAITLYELEVGIAKSSHPKKIKKGLDSFVSRITVLPFSSPQARACAQIRADLERKGTPIGPLDTLIAGTAVSANAVLVTHNRKEFERVKGLAVEDWF